MKINANIAALQTARHMNKTNGKISKSLERLSSGYKINSVEDDPTGTAVASKIKAQLYGLKNASRNSLDGVSLVQTAEGAMGEVHEILKRIRELSVQAANDTNAPEDRRKVQMEIDGLVEAIDQMADVTEFNKMKLLNGSLSNLTTITDSDSGARRYDMLVKHMSPGFPLGNYGVEVTGGFSNATLSAEYSLGEGKISMNGEVIDILPEDDDEAVQTKIQELADRFNAYATFNPLNPKSFTITSKESGSKAEFALEGSSITNPATLPVTAVGGDATVTLTGDFSNSVTAKIEGNRIFIYERGGETMQIDLTKMSAAGGKFNIEIEDKGQMKLQTGANEEQRIALMIPGLSSESLGLVKEQFFAGGGDNDVVTLVNVKNARDAERSIDILDEAVERVSDMRATLGAYQNRLEHTGASLDTNATNTEEALSRLMDTDMALEMSSYTLNNIVMQSAIAMLSQANERPQQLLQLLR